MAVYRFLLTPRWLGALALTLVAAVIMVLLADWQLARYHDRTAINERIDAGQRMDPVPLSEAVAAPTGNPGTVGPAPTTERTWTKVNVTGRYDTANVILVRGRSLDRTVGFEVLTPLLLTDGTAVLVNRGWVPPPSGGDATAQPTVPAAPAGTVTVTGRIRLGEGGSLPVTRRDGKLETRRVSLSQLGGELPYPIYGGYVLLDQQTPTADSTFKPVPVGYTNNWQNYGYVVQWWIFAGMTLLGFGYFARREAQRRSGTVRERPTDRTAEAAST